MNITFIRHTRLEQPYQDYNKLSFDEICDLGMQNVDPHIDLSLIPVEELKKLEIPDVIVHADSQRAIDLATYMKKQVFQSDVPLVETSLLNEILFNLHDLMTPEEFKKHRMSIVRERVLSYVLSNKEVLQKVDHDMSKIVKLVKIQNCNKVLCITHGFLMRFIDARLRQGSNLDNLVLGDVMSQKVYDYGTGFSVEV